MRLTNGIRFVAWVEAAKGGLVLLVGFGFLALVHHDVHAIAEQLVEQFRIDV